MSAKRGDLVLIEERRDYGSRQSEFSIERVTSVTRDGWPKATASFMFGSESEQPLFRPRIDHGHSLRIPRVYYVSHLLIPADQVDVVGLWAAWLARYDEWRVPPFASVDEARAFASPFKRQEV
jgi:hypothetical protein